MNDRDEIRSQFLALLAPFVDERNGHPITESSSLLNDLNVNSARFIDIILETEERFNISIDDASADRMRTVGDAIDIIVEKSTPVRAKAAVQSN